MSGLIAAIATGTAAVAGSISSFSQVAKQNKKMRQAEAEADRAMKEARKRLDVNVYEALSIQKEPYELAREAALVTGAQALQTGVEGAERGAAATAGRVAMAQAAEQARIRSAMGQELQGIQQQIVDEEGRLKDLGMGLDLQEAAGAQQAVADAEKARAAALQQGFEGLVQAGTTAMSLAPLYGGGGAPKVGTVGNQRIDYSMSPSVEARLGQPTLQQGQFSSYQYRPYPGMSQSDLLMQSFGGE